MKKHTIYIRRAKKYWWLLRLRWLRIKHWWIMRERRYGWWWRVANFALAVLIIAGVIAPIVQQLADRDSYTLNADALKLVGQPDQTLAKQLTYDASTQTYEFNTSAIKSDSTNPLAQMQAQLGTASGKGKDKSLYALDVPQNFSQGVTYHDINSGLSFSLVPEFRGLNGKIEQGHLVFPLAGNTQAIYTLKNNGLKEDIVVQKATSDTMTFSYRLDLPDTLQAKVIPGSDGNIGIYSADPSLFGNISYGSSSDRLAVEKARANSPKTYLVFGLPSPVIKDTSGNVIGNSRFVLSGNQLSVVATGLSAASGPVTIDPSVVVTSTSDFQTGNNEDNSISFSTSGQITRGGLTGGGASSGWTAATNNFTTGREQGTSIAYDGYLYMIGGNVYGGSGLNDIQSAPINSDGSLGTWQTALTLGGSQPISTVTLTEAVAYNGYLYLIGGYQYMTGVGTTNKTQVSWAPFNANGTLGNLQTVNSLPNGGETGGGVVAYNGYMYVLGGGPNGGGGGYYSAVYYAPINADGTLGSWVTSSNSLLQVTGMTQAVAYNGYIYVVGGASSGYINSVEYAKINSDGSLGTFMYTTGFGCGGRYGHAVYVYNGYLYVVAGIGATGCGSVSGRHTDAQYAPINANGTVGSWTQTSSVSASYGLQYVVGAAYNGYIYAMAGRNQAGTADSNQVQYAQIDPAGETTSWSSTGNTAITGTITNAGVATYNGYIYVMGGYDGTNYSATTRYAPLSTSGTIGAWTTVTSGTGALNTPEGTTCATIYNGYMYMVGGYTTGSVLSAVVQYAPINSNGSLGTWNTTTALPNATGNQCSVAYNGYLYIVSGTGGGSLNSVLYYAQLSSSGSITGSWNTTTSLNTARSSEAMLAYGGYMYVVGGYTGSPTNSVEYASINSNGTLGSWTATNSMGTDRNGPGAFIAGGYIYAIGGTTSSGDTATTEYAPINTNGSIGTWVANTSFTPGTLSKGNVAYYNGYAYSVSGIVGGSRVSTSYSAAINNGGPGTSGTWQYTYNSASSSSFTGGFTNTRYGHASVAYNGYLYVLGGVGASYYNDVQYAPINADGTIGTWQYTYNSASSSSFTGGFTNARGYLNAVAYKGYLYVLGGYNGTYYNDIQYAPINSNGTIGTWQYTYNSASSSSFTGGFTNARAAFGTVVYNGYLYIFGGSGASYYNDVQYAPINANGTIGTWQYTYNSASSSSFTGGFTNARDYIGTITYNGYLYIIGGYNGTTYFSDVQYAPINANGTIGTWAATTSLSTAREGGFATAYNGYVYLVGGNDGTSYHNDVQYAPINANGTLGTWATTSTFSNTRAYSAGVVYNGSLYLTGGYNGSFANDVQYAPLNVIPRVARYSKLIDFGSALNVSSLTYNGFLPGASSVTYKAAGSSGVFGASYAASNIVGIGGCAGNTTYTRYLFVTVMLDDSQSGSYPDVNGSAANLTDFTVNYNPVHPTPNIRLRAGQTLQQGNLSPLDTCYP